MRKSMNLVLAGALAASAFASTAAAQKAGCAPEEGTTLVTKKEAYEASESGPPPGFYSGHDIMTGDRGDLTVTLAWETSYDWDLAVYDADGEEVGSSAGDQFVAGEESIETVTVAKASKCTYYEIRVRNFIGVPADDITVTATID